MVWSKSELSVHYNSRHTNKGIKGEMGGLGAIAILSTKAFVVELHSRAPSCGPDRGRLDRCAVR